MNRLRPLLLAGLLAPFTARAQADDIEIEVEDDVEIEATAEPVPVPDTAELRATIAALEARLAAVEASQAAAAVEAEPPPPPPPDPKAPPKWVGDLGLKITGYVQGQYQASQISEDEVTPDGKPINRDRFVVRRARLRAEASYTYARAAIEIDANTVNGPQVTVRRAEGSVLLPQPVGSVPYAMFTAGLTGIPFGFELQQSQRERVFMERTAASRALFPGEADVGFKLSGGVGPFRYALAAQNGVPIGDFSTSGTEVFTKEKTFLGRLGVDTGTGPLAVSGGVSFLFGTGFHEGTPSTKPSLLWSDTNQDGFVTLNELIGVNGQARTPSGTFPQWAVDADLQVGIESPIGWTRVIGGVTVATNLDRALYVADPISTGYDLRELGWHAALTQDVTKWGVVGFRVDSYNPDSDLFESRHGVFLPTDATITTLSPVIGVQIPHVARLLFQYDYVVDHLGRDVRGEPADLANDAWVLRAQVEF